MDEETWVPIVGLGSQYYEVSNMGRVRSVARRTRSGRRITGRVLRPAIAKRGGYPTVSLKIDGVQRTSTVYSLVCEAFHGPRIPGLVVRHKDGDPLNSRADNLQWGTQSENNLDTVRHGRNAIANRECCIYGHPLEKPNVYEMGTAKNHRPCIACNRANASARYRGMKPTQQERDAHYADVLAGIDRRKKVRHGAH